MTQEEKELLLKDLCARLPYGVMVREDTVLYDDKNTTSHRIKKLSYAQIGKGGSRIKGSIYDYEYIYRPYLFPLSNMSKEQSNIYHELIGGMFGTSALINFEALEEFFNKNHLDYRGLIPMGLALDATGLNIY